ncbi:720b2ff0-0a06-4b09-9e1e-e5d252032ce5 [Thermothielavioides terrestris]|uniref:720b2ff0-0a06-4b09-9e1e-e5d252032ce5 n=1 Tax=Thermothielavioides terrestris TaxID=2587410 RepID=A0A446B7J6_9PEZI|nr:720b2ff0-0a06-4b09-9e1e-e5d252032ce5 [Thermothielavioides terrestris]
MVWAPEYSWSYFKGDFVGSRQESSVVLTSLLSQEWKIYTPVGIAVPSHDVLTGMMEEQMSDYDTAMTDKDKAVELLSCYVDENVSNTTIEKPAQRLISTAAVFIDQLLSIKKHKETLEELGYLEEDGFDQLSAVHSF